LNDNAFMGIIINAWYLIRFSVSGKFESSLSIVSDLVVRYVIWKQRGLVYEIRSN
jgi:hypothetical protein